MASRLLLFQVLDAVAAEGFPEELRHLCIRYAAEASSKTGRAWYGQEHMASMLGISERQLRRRLALLDELAADGRAPVRIVRRRRGRSGGAGRSSDEWRVEVVTEPNRTPVSSSDRTRSGHRRPVETEPEPDIHDTSRGHPRHLKRTSTTPQEDTGVLGSGGGILRRDLAEGSGGEPDNVEASQYPAGLEKWALATGLPQQFAERFGTSQDAVRDAITDHRDHWTIGAGAGEERDHWKRHLRRHLQKLGKGGLFKPPGLVEHEQNRPLTAQEQSVLDRAKKWRAEQDQRLRTRAEIQAEMDAINAAAFREDP